MSDKNPLQIPEIAELVASHLEGTDLARCVQVSKEWRDLLLPYRWRTVRAGLLPFYHHRGRFGPHPSDIHRHRHLIHDLTLLGETAGLENHNYPNLRILGLCHLGAEREVFFESTEMFPSLVSLHLNRPNMASPTWRAMTAHPRLTELMLCAIAITAADAPLFWALCMRLEILSLSSVTFDNRTIPAGTMFDRLRDLEVTDVNIALSAQLDLILRCQNLKRLSWNDFGYVYESEHPALDTDRIQKGYWHRLEKLSIQHHFRETQVAPLLDGVGDRGLIHLELYDCHLGNKDPRPSVVTLPHSYH